MATSLVWELDLRRGKGIHRWGKRFISISFSPPPARLLAAHKAGDNPKVLAVLSEYNLKEQTGEEKCIVLRRIGNAALSHGEEKKIVLKPTSNNQYEEVIRCLSSAVAAFSAPAAAAEAQELLRSRDELSEAKLKQLRLADEERKQQELQAKQKLEEEEREKEQQAAAHAAAEAAAAKAAAAAEEESGKSTNPSATPVSHSSAPPSALGSPIVEQQSQSGPSSLVAALESMMGSAVEYIDEPGRTVQYWSDIHRSHATTTIIETTLNATQPGEKVRLFVFNDSICFGVPQPNGLFIPEEPISLLACKIGTQRKNTRVSLVCPVGELILSFNSAAEAQSARGSIESAAVRYMQSAITTGSHNSYPHKSVYQTRKPSLEMSRKSLTGTHSKPAEKQGESEGIGMSLLHRAVANGDVARVQSLIDSRADVNAIDENSRTGLHIAAQGGFEAAATLLLDSGAEIGIIDLEGLSPAHVAVANHHPALLQLLCMADAKSVNLVDFQGRTPLILAVDLKDAQIALVMASTLLKYRASVDVRTASGTSPLEIAASHGYNEVLQLLANAQSKIVEKKPEAKAPSSSSTISTKQVPSKQPSTESRPAAKPKKPSQEDAEHSELMQGAKINKSPPPSIESKASSKNVPQKSAKSAAEEEWEADLREAEKEVHKSANNAAADAKLALEERGQKLGKLQEFVERQQTEAANFANLAQQLAEREKNKKWWQI